MQTRTQKFSWLIVCIIATVLVISLGWGLYQSRKSAKEQDRKPVALTSIKAPRDRNVPQVLELSDAMIQAMHLKTVQAVVPGFSKVLHFRGSLAIDPNRLSHVHARFPGQIIELATISGLRSQQLDPSVTTARLLQNFDIVTEGMKLAILQSKDLGEKKSQLADALIRLRVEEKTLNNLRLIYEKGNFPEKAVREQEAKFEQAKIAVFTAENTLRAFQVTDADIDGVKESAEKYHRGQETDTTYVKEWSRVVVTAPISGDIVEKSVIIGDIVDANADLFKIADLSVLAVYLHPYEEDLQALEQLPKPLQVLIKVPAYPELGELSCDVDRSSPMIDPNEHMALLIGKVKNPDRKLKANQFVTADVGAPMEKGVVEIPSNSVIDLGYEAIVFVQPDASKSIFQRRRVVIVRRYFDVVYVRSELTAEQEKQGLQPIQAGESVVKGWILELEDYMQQQH
jgi:cobalt-zinc-cadmium efflux system membrane fusion protein